MNRIVKLLIAVLVSGFLGGCGGGGGNSSSSIEGPISFDGIAASFPAFDDYNLTISNVYSYKEYINVANTSVYESALNASGSGFSMNGGNYNKTYPNVLIATVSFLSSGQEINIGLASASFVTHNDAAYKRLFPAIDEEIAVVSLEKDYAVNINSTAEVAAYFTLFDNSWTMGGDNITWWDAYKNGTNGFTYYASASGGVISWTIYNY